MSDEHPYHSLEQPVSNQSHQLPANSLEETLPSHAQVEQSKRLPRWVWLVICSLLGISHQPDTELATLPRRRKVFATILYGITLVLSLLYLSTYCWYKVYDIKSTVTKSTVLTGLVEIVICVGWCALGVYANNLASRLLSNQKFVDSVRTRTKTVFKLSAAFVIVVLGMVFFAVRFYQDYEDRYRKQVCQDILLNVVVCQVEYISEVCFSVFALIWNLMVGLILLSVCRTHTVGIRRFIKELEADAKLYERFCREKMMAAYSAYLHSPGDTAGASSFHVQSIRLLNESDWYIWDEEESSESSSFNSMLVRSQSCASYRSGAASATTAGNNQADFLRSSMQSCEVKPEDHSATAYCPAAMVSNSADPDPPSLMSSSDILLYYWMIMSRLRTTSLALQRWLASWICFVFIWCANYVIWWTSHEATLLGIAEFVVPLLLLPLVCSAYAETNNDGIRMIRCIFPTERRMALLHYLNNQPLQMTVFNFPVTFSAIIGVVGAFSLAFASRMILDQVIHKHN